MTEFNMRTPSHKPRFDAMIGTGGIGSGSLFLVNGNHTVGREESRSGRFADARDYCKLHIIAHYVKVLVGPEFPVYPIGKIGEDDVGRSLYRYMEAAGLDMTYVEASSKDQTLYSFCFIYPDGTGGNFTTENSACARVDSNFIEKASKVFSQFNGRSICLAAPEVPIQARKKLLELCQDHNGFAVTSFLTGEVRKAEQMGLFELVDLLAINIDEAAALTGTTPEKAEPSAIVKKSLDLLRTRNPSICLSITAGMQGSWLWDTQKLSFIPACEVKAVSAAGAGDAHIAGIIAGLTAGLSLEHAQMLGNLTAAFSVTSRHSIHPQINRNELLKLAKRVGYNNPELLGYLSSPC